MSVPTNITLIGMSGVGKSYYGARLAERLGFTFVDSDRILEQKWGKSIDVLLTDLGQSAFLQAEEACILEIAPTLHSAVIAPGGSVIYSEPALRELKRVSSIVYLAASSSWIEQRIDPTQRGIVGLESRSFAEVCHDRFMLYEAAADYTVTIEGGTEIQNIEEICALFYKQLPQR